MSPRLLERFRLPAKMPSHLCGGCGEQEVLQVSMLSRAPSRGLRRQTLEGHCHLGFFCDGCCLALCCPSIPSQHTVQLSRAPFSKSPSHSSLASLRCCHVILMEHPVHPSSCLTCSQAVSWLSSCSQRAIISPARDLCPFSPDQPPKPLSQAHDSVRPTRCISRIEGHLLPALSPRESCFMSEWEVMDWRQEWTSSNFLLK